MHARHRSAILIGLCVLALFIVRWPINNYISDSKTWPWRPSPTEGTNFFSSVFRGGGGTPAVFAMLGGQRYMISKMMWDYSEVLFHQGKLYEMIYPMDAAVTLNPSFTEVWSTYGWHLAWNIYTSTDDPVEKKKWMDAGINVYVRAIKANPKKPSHRFDLAWLYMQREGNYRKALELLQPVVESGEFKPEPAHVSATDQYAINEWYWNPQQIGHGLGITYMKLGTFTGDWRYFQKALETYQYCLRIKPDDKTAPAVIKRLKENMHNEEWLKEQQQIEAQVRGTFGFSDIPFGKTMEEIFPDTTTGIETLDSQ